jgi:hypothetical protein
VIVDKTIDCQEVHERLNTILKLMSDWDKASHTVQRERHSQIQEQQKAISDSYGARRGWREASKRFPLSALARLRVADEDWEQEFTDHRSFWTLHDRPFAVAAHLYGCDDRVRDAACAWAASRGLQATFPVDFPSWWYPGRTTLIELTSAG